MKEEKDYSLAYKDDASPFTLRFPNPKSSGPISILRGRVDQTWMLIEFPSWTKNATFRNEPGGELYIALLDTGISPGQMRSPDQNFLRLYEGETIVLPLAREDAMMTIKHKFLLVASNVTSLDESSLLGHSFVVIADRNPA